MLPLPSRPRPRRRRGSPAPLLLPPSLPTVCGSRSRAGYSHLQGARHPFTSMNRSSDADLFAQLRIRRLGKADLHSVGSLAHLLKHLRQKRVIELLRELDQHVARNAIFWSDPQGRCRNPLCLWQGGRHARVHGQRWLYLRRRRRSCRDRT